MKNREEYEASIFAKRDALLAKRKKKIQAAISAMCIIMCFGAAAYAMPKMMNISSDNEAEGLTAPSDWNEYGTYEEKQAEEATESLTLITHLTVTKTASALEDSEYSTNDTYKSETYNEFAEEAGNASEAETANEVFDANKQFGYDGSSGNTAAAPESTKKASSMGKYTSKEIIEAAKKYLSEDELKAVEGIEPFTTATRTSNGEEYYDILFSGEETAIKLTLNAENLELVEKKILATSTESSGTTAKPPVTAALPERTTPAYNPNE